MLTQTKIVLAAALILGAAGVAAASAGSGTTYPTNPNLSSATRAGAGVAPGVNANNSQDMNNRSNPQDMTLPGASNPQDLVR
jgi:hypothetical protein